MYDYVSVTTAEPGASTPVRDGTIKLHDEAGFAGMRKAGRLAAEILDALVPMSSSRGSPRRRSTTSSAR